MEWTADPAGAKAIKITNKSGIPREWRFSWANADGTILITRWIQSLNEDQCYILFENFPNAVLGSIALKTGQCPCIKAEGSIVPGPCVCSIHTCVCPTCNNGSGECPA